VDDCSGCFLVEEWSDFADVMQLKVMTGVVFYEGYFSEDDIIDPKENILINPPGHGKGTSATLVFLIQVHMS
jgi:hypothetical protein